LLGAKKEDEKMSLDVYLEADAPPTSLKSGSGIFIRQNGETIEMSREEWDRAFPDQEPVIMTADADANCTVYDRNITHNLGKMADAAGVYYACWRPEERGWSKAKDLIEPLEAGLQRLQDDPDAFKVHNPSNGWGDYDGLVRFVAEYLQACREYPDAHVRVSR
jgi:hypothetical protein